MKPHLVIVVALVCAACTEPSTVTRDQEPALLTAELPNPADTNPGTCWDKTETPAVIKTIDEDVLIQPAQISSTGTIQSPPIYRSQSRPVIVQERQEQWFQILCPTDLTPDFVSSVQRALELRGHYGGSITGQMDSSTRAAIKRYQFERDIDTADPEKLTVAAARQLGLWTAERVTES